MSDKVIARMTLAQLQERSPAGEIEGRFQYISEQLI